MASTRSNSPSESWGRVAPSSSAPALKSIQPGLRPAMSDWVEIFAVGTGQPKGVPRPVVNSTICAPAAASAVEATRSLPGAESRLRPFLVTR